MSNYITISKANSLVFRKQGETLKTFDNTLSADEDFHGVKIYDTCPVKYLASDTITFQIKAEKLINLVFTLYLIEADGTRNAISVTKEVAGLPTYDYWEAEIDFSGYSGKVYFTLNATADLPIDYDYISEPVEVLTETESETDTLKLQWFCAAYNNTSSFEMYYGAPNRITPMIRLKANHFVYESGGESVIYDNDGEPVKLKQTVKRILKLETDTIPRYLAEMLAVGLGHDFFSINEVRYSSGEDPDIDPIGKTNLVQLSSNLTQVNVVGINAHDIGFDCDTISSNDDVMVHELTGVSGNQSQVITSNYLLHAITINWNAGTNVSVEIGISPGGGELHPGLAVSTTEDSRTVAPHADTAYTGTTIYFAITGTGANVDIKVQTIKNEE